MDSPDPAATSSRGYSDSTNSNNSSATVNETALVIAERKSQKLSESQALWSKLFEEKRTSFVNAGYAASLTCTNETDFLTFLKQQCDRYNEQKFPVVLAKLNPALRHIASFGKSIGAVAQANMFSSIAWGGFSALIQYGIKFEQTLESIADILLELVSSIPFFDANSALYPDAETLQHPLRMIFSEYCDFCLLAIRFFKKPTRRLLESLASPLQRDLEKTKKTMDTYRVMYNNELSTIQFGEAKKLQIYNFKLMDQIIQNQNLGLIRPTIVDAKPEAGHASPHGTTSTAALSGQESRKSLNMPPKNPHFLGRETILNELDQRLWPVSHPDAPILVSCALEGMGGVGKTQISQHYIHERGNKYGLVIWIRAEDGAERIRQFCEIAKAGGNQNQNDVDSAREWLENTGIKWLLIFDNVDEFDDIAALWPKSSRNHGSIIVTTRKEELSPRIDSVIPVEPMGTDDGTRLLKERSEQPDADPDDIHRILEIAGGLPLIITIIGAFVKPKKNRAATTLKEFINMYDSSPDVLWTGRGWEGAWQYQDRQQPGKVFALALKKLMADERRLINILAFLSPDAVPEDLLLSSNNEPTLKFLTKKKNKFSNMIFHLTESSLIKYSANATANGYELSMHRVVQDFIVNDLSSVESSSEASLQNLHETFQQAFKIVRKATPEAAPRMQPAQHNSEAYNKALPQISSFEAVYQRLDKSMDERLGTYEFAKLLSEAGMHMWATGLTKNGLRLLKSAEGVLDQINYSVDSLLRTEINTVIAVLNDNVGISQRAEGKWRREKALKFRRDFQQSTPPRDFTKEDDILLYNAEADLACSYLQFHEFERAEAVWERCLVKYKEWGPPEKEKLSYEYSKYNHHMSFVRVYQRRLDEAIELGNLGIKYMADSLGPDHPLTYRYKYDQACVYLQAGLKEKSLEMQKEIFEWRNKKSGKYHELTLQSCYSVGALYDYCGNMVEARAHMEEALNRQKTGKGFWPEELQALLMYHLSQIMERQESDLKQACELRENSLEIQRRLLAEDELPTSLQGVEDHMAMFEHMLPVFNGRFSGVMLLQYVGLTAPKPL